MTQEEKELLLKDLCARLPYGVKCTFYKKRYIGTIVNIFDPTTDEFGGLFPLITVFDNTYHKADLTDVKPYLRPMSSMTEEIYEYNKLVELDRSNKESFNNLRIEYIQNHPEYKNMPCVPMYRHIDYLNTYHFDYRGLIPMGLALPAPEGMYNTKTE